MNSIAFIIPFLVAAITLSSNTPGALAGLPCFNCPNIPPLSCPDGLQLVECDSDCKATHYSAGGACDSNFNCICSGPPANPDKCEAALLNGVRVPACQCQSNLPGAAGGAFQSLCNFDCQCNHGAEFGTCLFDKHQCLCNSTAGFVWSRSTCPIDGGRFDVEAALRPLIDSLLIDGGQLLG